MIYRTVKIFTAFSVIFLFQFSFLQSVAAYGQEVLIHDIHPPQKKFSSLIRDTLENTTLTIIAKANQFDPNSKILCFEYLYSGPDNIPRRQIFYYFTLGPFPNSLKQKSKISPIESFTSLTTLPVEDDKFEYKMNIYLRVKDYNNNLIGKDSKIVTVHKQFEILPCNDENRILHPWESVSATYYGDHEIGYSELKRKALKRRYTISPQVGCIIGLVSIAFNVDFTEESTSEILHKRTVRRKIPKDERGVWYRRCEEIRKEGFIYQWDEYGNRIQIAKIQIIDWDYSAFLRITNNGKWENLPK